MKESGKLKLKADIQALIADFNENKDENEKVDSSWADQMENEDLDSADALASATDDVFVARQRSQSMSASGAAAASTLNVSKDNLEARHRAEIAAEAIHQAKLTEIRAPGDDPEATQILGVAVSCPALPRVLDVPAAPAAATANTSVSSVGVAPAAVAATVARISEAGKFADEFTSNFSNTMYGDENYRLFKAVEMARRER